MRCDGDDGDYGDTFLAPNFVGAVVPKDAISFGSIVLGVGFEHLLPVGTTERGELVRVEPRMVWIGLKKSERFIDLLGNRSGRVFFFQSGELSVRSWREFQFAVHDGLLRVLGERATIDRLPVG